MIVMFSKFIISSRDGHRDCSPWASKNLATPLPPCNLKTNTVQFNIYVQCLQLMLVLLALPTPHHYLIIVFFINMTVVIYFLVLYNGNNF